MSSRCTQPRHRWVPAPSYLDKVYGTSQIEQCDHCGVLRVKGRVLRPKVATKRRAR